MCTICRYSTCRYWTLVEEQPDLWTPVPDPLPSDARFRLDLDTLLTGDLVAAQVRRVRSG